ncbi:hypothetical protein [Psychrobacter sp. WY6]|uniref:hypothetical protein n=1 Tax=Psychrobacter sp. WY6 TaxID=2708350 RepID=UPI002022CBBA|nr:hypothetical protein [Psychrobacter sp. WY6]
MAWALLRGCQENPEPVATPVATAQQAAQGEGQLAVAGDSLHHCALRLVKIVSCMLAV